jgi:hypothetical protein
MITDISFYNSCIGIRKTLNGGSTVYVGISLAHRFTSVFGMP